MAALAVYLAVEITDATASKTSAEAVTARAKRDINDSPSSMVQDEPGRESYGGDYT
jgi:hypothetical protein